MSAYVKSKYVKFKHMSKSLRYIIPAIVGHEVGLANLKAEVYKPTLFGGDNNSCIYIMPAYHVNRAGL